MRRHRLDFEVEGNTTFKAEALVEDVAAAGGWPVERGRWRSLSLRLAERDGDTGVFDAAARPRLETTLRMVGRVFFGGRLHVGRPATTVRGATKELTARVGAERLADDTTYEMVWEGHLVKRRPEPQGVSIDAAWDRIEAWLAEHDVDAQLRPGAEEEAIAAAEQAIGVAFPPPLRAFLRRHSGQDGLAGIVESNLLLGVEEIVDEWRMRQKVQDEQDDDVVWWRREWVPFTHDGSGDGFCLDTRTGEVLYFMHDADTETVAASFEGWLARWAEELEHGELVLDDGNVVPAYSV